MEGKLLLAGSACREPKHDHFPAQSGLTIATGNKQQEIIMKSFVIAATAIVLIFGAGVVRAEQSQAPGDCGAPQLIVKDGKVALVEGEQTREIKIRPAASQKAALAAARTTCRSGGGYTVCSNGRYGCVWSDRSGRLLGCGAGI